MTKTKMESIINTEIVTTTRDITRKECPWLPKKIIKAGIQLYLSKSFSYGACAKGGIMVSFYKNPDKEKKSQREPDDFEVPINALNISKKQYIDAEFVQGNIAYRDMIDTVLHSNNDEALS